MANDCFGPPKHLQPKSKRAISNRRASGLLRTRKSYRLLGLDLRRFDPKTALPWFCICDCEAALRLPEAFNARWTERVVVFAASPWSVTPCSGVHPWHVTHVAAFRGSSFSQAVKLAVSSPLSTPTTPRGSIDGKNDPIFQSALPLGVVGVVGAVARMNV